MKFIITDNIWNLNAFFIHLYEADSEIEHLYQYSI